MTPPYGSATRGAAVLVLLCHSLERLGDGLDFSRIRLRLERTDPGLRVEVVADLCRRPRELDRAAADGAQRLVMGVCSGETDEVELHRRAMKLGLDPLAIQRVNLGGFCALPHPRPEATAKAVLLLSAAVARARAYAGSTVENLKPRLLGEGQKISRRTLFTLPPLVYKAVASVDQERCAAGAGCRLCLDVCPRLALAATDGRVFVDRSACDACGICVMQCPRSAIRLPGQSADQLDAELAGLMSGPPAPKAPLFVCRRNAAVLERLGADGQSYPAEWLPVVLPCTGMVSAVMLLRGLALSASAVGVVVCGGGCPYGQAERTQGRVEFCREFLTALGRSPEQIRVFNPVASTAELAEFLRRQTGDPSWEREAPPPGTSPAVSRASTFLALAREAAAPTDLSVAHPYSPFGVVEIDSDRCTGCAVCAERCPTDALTLERDEGGLALAFDASLCIACDLCTGGCPEDAVRLETRTDLEALTRGKTTVHRDHEVRCEMCSAVIAPRAMLRRVEALLSQGGGDSELAIGMVTRRCPSCRLAALPAPERRR